MITHPSIVSIPVSDQDRSLAFYHDQLGFEVTMDNPLLPDGSRWIQVRPAGSATSFTLVTWFPNMRPGGVTGIVLEADDLDATYAALQAKGVALGAIDTQPWGRFATFQDPDGNGFILQKTAFMGS